MAQSIQTKDVDNVVASRRLLRSLHGALDDTEKAFADLREKAAENYISGRFD